MNSKYEDKIITIPNILSIFRILLIPVFINLYLLESNDYLAGAVVVLSAITDLVDGYIARKYNMISRVGKVLDPIADKLTQAAVLFCLMGRYPLMIIPFILLFIKEIITGITGYIVVQKTGIVYGAKWHGKLSTGLLYSMAIIHLFWSDIPSDISNILIIICIFMMSLSFIQYGIQNINLVRDK